jgi:hypothetical protein
MRYKVKFYKVFYQKKTFIPVKTEFAGWKYAKRSLDWFKSKGIKAYAKRTG